MRICIHRGTQEIGGNCIELKSQGKSLVLDVGRPLSAADDEHVQLHTFGSDVVGVVISHGHMDHWGLVDQLAPGTPVYIGEVTAAILREAAFWTKGAQIEAAGHLRDWEPIDIGPFRVTPFLVDHSAFDAYALLVEADGERVFYSADVRTHGAKGGLVERLIAEPPSDVDVLLIEGTSIPADGPPKPHGGTERDVAARVADIASKTDGMVLASYSAQNIDRMVQLYRAAKACDRQFVMDLYTASIALLTDNENIPKPGAEWSAVRVYVPQWQRRKVLESKEFHRVGGAIKKARIFADELASMPYKFITKLSLGTLFELEKAEALTGAHAIWSLWPGYLEEDTRLRDQLHKLGIPLTVEHTSGHATPEDLSRLAHAISPKTTVPIHSFGTNRASQYFPDVELKGDGEWWAV